ncbi:outer membrane beta-barrel protein [Parapedobacter luteus]|uniref:outer membrane beta-barrel protein n=1 Tax=Parapedobacter luteus TaxID=623280 RepID=UPI001591FBB5|nr:outer membrane beta-barrel protein [Parapedobacter luteus]
MLTLPISVSHAQTSDVFGKVSDISDESPMHQASVVLLNAKDSIIYADARTQNGIFSFKDVDYGSYKLLVTYPDYTDFVMPVIVDRSGPIDLGNIKMWSDMVLLDEVLVTGKKKPIRIIGDTIEYNPSLYNLAPHATAQDLLKQLDGINVDKDGNITAMGKKVTRVYVDGEEFFGHDPVLVTTNIRADMIEKVQVYDRKSDNAAFTGIDDGKDEKAVNMKLKDDSKIGLFGKVGIGIGNEDFYNANGFFNHFNNDRKFSVYGLSNNVGSVGLSSRDRQQYADGSFESTYNNYDLDPWNGEYSGKGIPTSSGLGSQFSNKYYDGKFSLNINYNFNDIVIDGIDHNIVQDNLPTSFFITDVNRTFHNHMQKHNFSGTFKVDIDQSSSISIKTNVGRIKKTTDNHYISSTLDSNSRLLNSNTRSFSTGSNKRIGMINLLYLKKFRKERRTISIAVDIFDTKSNSDGGLESNTFTYRNENNIYLNQEMNNSDGTSFKTIRSTYTEPLTKYSTIEASIEGTVKTSLLFRNNEIVRADVDFSYVDSLSLSDYKLNQVFGKGGIKYHFNKAKFTIQLGSEFIYVNFDQRSLDKDYLIKRNFDFFQPSADFTYRINPLTSISLKYFGFSNMPDILLLQPFVNNVDPLNIVIGNEELNPSFSNRLTLGYNSYNDQKNILMYANGSLTITNIPIGSTIVTDANGVSTYSYVNVEGGKNISYNSSFGVHFPSPIPKVGMSINGSFLGNRIDNFVNSKLSQSDFNSYSLSVGFGGSKENTYNGGLSVGVMYNTNYNNLQPDYGNKYWGYSFSPNSDFYLPYGITLNTGLNYLFQGKTKVFTEDFRQAIWNSSLEKKFLKDKSLSIKLSVNDILDQNRGFQRSMNNSQIIQNTYSTIGRYFMVSCLWNFRKF